MKKRRKPKSPEQAPRGKRGPREARVAIPGDWETAVKQALKKRRPKAGWPKATGGRGK